MLLEILLNKISDADQATIYYTSGFVARPILKGVKCESCKELLVDLESDECKKSEYLNLLNRGGDNKTIRYHLHGIRTFLGLIYLYNSEW